MGRSGPYFAGACCQKAALSGSLLVALAILPFKEELSASASLFGGVCHTAVAAVVPCTQLHYAWEAQHAVAALQPAACYRTHASAHSGGQQQRKRPRKHTAS